MKKPIITQGTVEYAIEQVKNGASRPRLLLHACCGPCAAGVLDYIAPYFDITVFFYNPNIMPKEEFNIRIDALKTVLSHYPDAKLIIPEQYETEYIAKVKGLETAPEGGSRCGICFGLRLEKTAEYLKAHANDFDAFATTLTVSPHKNAPLINKIGENIASTYGVQYLCSDFKKRDGYLRSTKLCKEWNIYRQSYCGCKFD